MRQINFSQNKNNKLNKLKRLSNKEQVLRIGKKYKQTKSMKAKKLKTIRAMSKNRISYNIKKFCRKRIDNSLLKEYNIIIDMQLDMLQIQFPKELV